MEKKVIKFHHKTTMFGTTISASSEDGKYNTIICENMPNNPMKLIAESLNKAFIFRSSKISIQDLGYTFKILSDFTDKFALAVYQTDDDLYAVIKIKNKNDMEIFGWNCTNIWEKWSLEQEREYWKDFNKKPNKIFVDKNGNVKVKVTVSGLDKI